MPARYPHMEATTTAAAVTAAANIDNSRFMRILGKREAAKREAATSKREAVNKKLPTNLEKSACVYV